MAELLLAGNAFATCFMAGLIWFVQIVHYPLFSAVGEDAFVAYENVHQRRTTWVVAPAMLVELATALLLPRYAAGVGEWWLLVAGAVMAGSLWVITAGVQVPLHRKLQSGWDADVARRLVRSNWSRTVLWTSRGVLSVAIIVARTAA